MNFIKRIMINYMLKKGKLININDLPNEQDRDRILVEFSTTNNIPIVVGRQNRWYDLKNINQNVEVFRLAPNFTIDFKDREIPNGVLIEETVKLEMTSWLKLHNIEIRGGFIYKGENNEG